MSLFFWEGCHLHLFQKSTEKVSEHQFYINITQYFMRQPASTASFHCHFPQGNVRFERVGVPRPKTQTVIVGFIMASSSPTTNTCAVKRIPIEIGEIQYLRSAMTTVSSSPSQKGIFFFKSLLFDFFSPLFFVFFLFSGNIIALP